MWLYFVGAALFDVVLGHTETRVSEESLRRDWVCHISGDLAADVVLMETCVATCNVLCHQPSPYRAEAGSAVRLVQARAKAGTAEPR